MSKLLVDRIPFARILLDLAIIFGLSILFAVLIVIIPFDRTLGGAFLLGMIPWGGMMLSLLGLVLTAILWLALSIVDRFRPQAADPQKLFGDEEERARKRKKRS